MIELLFLICLPFDWNDCSWDFDYYTGGYPEDAASIGVGYKESIYNRNTLRFSPNFYDYNDRSIFLTNKTVWQNAMLLIEDKNSLGFNCGDCVITDAAIVFYDWYGQGPSIWPKQEFTYPDELWDLI